MTALEKIMALLFPLAKTCLLCGKGKAQDGICQGCRKKISARNGFSLCPVCGRYHAQGNSGNENNKSCVECLKFPPSYFAARSLGPYKGILKEAIYLYKYRGYRSLSDVFGQLLAELFLSEPCFAGTDLLVPVPLSLQKTNSRGFNQSELLAARLGQLLNLPVETCLIRVRHTPSQSKLTGKARREIVKGVFALGENPRPGNVILIDDIFTTGATAEECVSVLLTAEVKSVGVLTLASGIQENINN
ncbi:MAG: ComF family protein [Eubacteriales bacterium]